jgi:hypothetical protein
MKLSHNLILSAVLLLVAISTTTEAFITSHTSLGMGVRVPHKSVLLQASSSNSADYHDEIQHQRSRKEFLQTVLLSFTTVSIPLIQTPAPANADYGASSNMELPNYIEFLIEKNTVVDQSKVLYKGADIQVQISRISDASKRLSEIPSIAKQKKWSQVQGILTGPLGTLIQTMNSLCKDTDSGDAKKAAAKVKSDIIAVSQEASRKNEAGVVKACEAAEKDLEAFAKLVF